MTSDDPAEGFLPGVDARARELLNRRGHEYDVGMELMGFAMSYLQSEDEAGGIYLVWGCLTDLIDGPRSGEPGVIDTAVADMRRAAEEWLAVRTTQVDVHAYVDRWVHEECGYERKIS